MSDEPQSKLQIEPEVLDHLFDLNLGCVPDKHVLDVIAKTGG